MTPSTRAPKRRTSAYGSLKNGSDPVRHAAHLRGLNLDRVLAVAIDRTDTFTRAEISVATGLSAPTVGSLASELIRVGRADRPRHGTLPRRTPSVVHGVQRALRLCRRHRSRADAHAARGRRSARGSRRASDRAHAADARAESDSRKARRAVAGADASGGRTTRQVAGGRRRRAGRGRLRDGASHRARAESQGLVGCADGLDSRQGAGRRR